MVIFLVEMIILDEILDGKIDIFYEILFLVYDISVVIGSFFFYLNMYGICICVCYSVFS